MSTTRAVTNAVSSCESSCHDVQEEGSRLQSPCLPSCSEVRIEDSFWKQVQMLCLKKEISIQELANQAGISRTTLYLWSTGQTSVPRNSTLVKIASVLQVSVERLFPQAGCNFQEEPEKSKPTFQEQRREFDRSTNILVDEIVATSPKLFEEWSLVDWDELYSCFGTGGHLNEEGIRQVADDINRKRDVLSQVELLLETDLKDSVITLVAALYQTITPSQSQFL